MLKTKVLIVDDHPAVCRSLKELLETEEGFAVIGTAKDGEEAVAQSRKLPPDLIIMDFALPKMDGIEASRIIKKANPEIKIVILSVYNNGKNIFRAREAGVSEWVTKNLPPDKFIQILRDVIQGVGERRKH